jgi:hypothetical protein
MSRPLGLLLALTLPALPAPTARAAAAPWKVRTGLRVVAVIREYPGMPAGKMAERTAGAVAVMFVPEIRGKAAVEARTDAKGVCLVALPTGKYRVVADSPVKAWSATVEVKEGAVSEVSLYFNYYRR